MSRVPEVRPALGAGDDAAHVAVELHALEVLVEPRPWSLATFADELARSDRCWLTARADEGSVLVGFAGAALLADAVHVLRCTVDPARRRRGTGARLVAALVAWARTVGARALTLEVRASNGPAVALYEAAGLTVRGRRPGYYPDGEDAVLMTLDLDPTAPRADADAGPVVATAPAAGTGR